MTDRIVSPDSFQADDVNLLSRLQQPEASGTKKDLIDQLFNAKLQLGSFAQVIICASETMTKGSATNDFAHSQAVHWRLSALLESEMQNMQFGINAIELFILCASSYLHDIGRLPWTKTGCKAFFSKYNPLNIFKPKSSKRGGKTSSNERHGNLSADRIMNDENLKYLFPARAIQNQVAKISDYHDRDIEDYRELENNLELDIRFKYSLGITKPQKVTIRPKYLASVFRLADELECNSDRMIGQSESSDPRRFIAGVIINSRSRLICLDYNYGTGIKNQQKCNDHMKRILDKLKIYLDAYSFTFRLVGKEEIEKSFNEIEENDNPNNPLTDFNRKL